MSADDRTGWLRRCTSTAIHITTKDRFLQSLRQPERLIVKLQSAKADVDPEAMVAAFDIVLAKG
jgi:hypothetical protein